MSEIKMGLGRPKEADQQRAKYDSPFEKIDYRKASEAIDYNGTLGNVLEDLKRAIHEPGQPDKTALLLHPPRAIRAAIDYKVARPDLSAANDLVKESIALGLKMYKDPEHSTELLERFTVHVEEDAPDLMTLPLVQKKDVTTWEASHHERSEKSALELAEGNDDVLFIALAHGGVAAGMDTYLRYCDIKKSTESSFYVVRLSHSSTYDKDPQISKPEEEYLRDQSSDRSVVIFDEDQGTGMTLESAESSIQTIVGKPVRGIANMGAPAGHFYD
jgi:hypothetical protein